MNQNEHRNSEQNCSEVSRKSREGRGEEVEDEKEEEEKERFRH
jgi:hypothetical protein